MREGTILKSLSGFYYVGDGTDTYTCRGRGKLRHANVKPLVGDRVLFEPANGAEGTLDEVLPRRNEFHRPAVANIDQLVIIVSHATPTTDPFLIDRLISIAERKDCQSIVCINKWDLEPGEGLYAIYSSAGFPTLRISAETGQGLEELWEIIAGKVSAFTGNSGVGKSSILNGLKPGIALPTGGVSEKLGRGRHTTRHVELFPLGMGALVADTPGFSSFDTGKTELGRKENLALTFREFRPYWDKCRYTGCSHTKEQGCAVLEALNAGKIQPSRHTSYVRLYEQLKLIPDWES